MKVAVALEHRFQRTPDGAIWTGTFFANSFWQRYRSVFDAVRVIARVEDVAGVPETAKRVDGAGVEVAAIPYYVGPLQYALRSREVSRAASGAIRSGDAVVLRVSSQISTCIERTLRAQQRPYAVEVVADPADVFAPGAVRHPLRPFLRWWFPRNLRRQCAHAAAAAYVTEGALQKRYPAGLRAFATHYSSVELNDESFVASPRTVSHIRRPLRLLMAGTLEELYKAPDVLIDAAAICARGGLRFTLAFLGDGRRKEQLRKQAAALGIADKVEFLGSVPGGSAVREEMDRADVFVLPSRQEGLPRAMVEAMARALPCIGSRAGGIPELIAAEDVVPVGDARALAARIFEVANDPGRMSAMSERNLIKAREYHEDILSGRRSSFYERLAQATAAWTAARENSGEAGIPAARREETV